MDVLLLLAMGADHDVPPSTLDCQYHETMLPEKPLTDNDRLVPEQIGTPPEAVPATGGVFILTVTGNWRASAWQIFRTTARYFVSAERASVV
jgi:hypothetical protein